MRPWEVDLRPQPFPRRPTSSPPPQWADPGGWGRGKPGEEAQGGVACLCAWGAGHKNGCGASGTGLGSRCGRPATQRRHNTCHLSSISEGRGKVQSGRGTCKQQVKACSGSRAGRCLVTGGHEPFSEPLEVNRNALLAVSLTLAPTLTQ